MRLIHTLLFFIREDRIAEDKILAAICLKSLEKSTYRDVVLYNQGCLTNEELKEFLSQFNLNFTVIGDAQNTGTVVGRQRCFESIWETHPDTEYISEIHLDMLFPQHWEDPLVDYLDKNDEPMISCGIIDSQGVMGFIDSQVHTIPADCTSFQEFLNSLKCDKIVYGFTNPCIHKSKIIQFTGGYNPRFLKGKHCFEDDSMLLGYFYYYGTRTNWKPKVNYHSVVYHQTAGQRLTVSNNVYMNFFGLIKQYGVMGLKHLSQLHQSELHKQYFEQQYHNF